MYISAFKRTVTAIGIASLFVGSASAAELLVTPASSKSGNSQVALDIVSDGDVSGFQFAINVGKGLEGKVDVSKCLSELPSGFSGQCQLAKGKVFVIAMADRVTTLPAGVISVGSIEFPAATLEKAGARKPTFSITDMEFVDVNGTPLNASSQISK